MVVLSSRLHFISQLCYLSLFQGSPNVSSLSSSVLNALPLVQKLSVFHQHQSLCLVQIIFALWWNYLIQSLLLCHRLFWIFVHMQAQSASHDRFLLSNIVTLGRPWSASISVGRTKASLFFKFKHFIHSFWWILFVKLLLFLLKTIFFFLLEHDCDLTWIELL